MAEKVGSKSVLFLAVFGTVLLLNACYQSQIPETAFVRHAEAVNLYSAGEYHSAREILHVLADEYPTFHQSLTLLGKTCYMMDDAEAAVRFLSQALEAAPGSVDAGRWLSRSYLQLNDYDSALNAVQNALEYSADDPSLLLLLAKSYRGTGQLDKAVLAFERSTAAADRMAEVFIEAGEFYRSMGFAERSLELYRKAAAFLPEGSSLRPAIDRIIKSLEVDN